MWGVGLLLPDGQPFTPALFIILPHHPLPAELKSHLDIVHFIRFQRDFPSMPLFFFLWSWFYFKLSSWDYYIANIIFYTRPFIFKCHLSYTLLNFIVFWRQMLLSVQICFLFHNYKCLFSFECGDSFQFMLWDLFIDQGLFFPITYSCFSG